MKNSGINQKQNRNENKNQKTKQFYLNPRGQFNGVKSCNRLWIEVAHDNLQGHLPFVQHNRKGVAQEA